MSLIARLLAIFAVASFEKAKAIVQADAWFTGKTNAGTKRFVNLATGEVSREEKPGFTLVDIDEMNKRDRGSLTEEELNTNPGLLAAFIFSVKSNVKVYEWFCAIIQHLHKIRKNPTELNEFEKMYVSHLAWLLANLDSPEANWKNLTYDPLVKRMTEDKCSPMVSTPEINDGLFMSSHAALFYKVITSKPLPAEIESGLAMDANRFDTYLASME